MHFVDTNIFIHYIFPNVDSRRYQACRTLFERAESGEISLWTSEWVIAELVWFLYRKHKPWSEIKGFIVDGIIKGKQVKVSKEKVVLEIIESSRNDSDFVDYMNKHILFRRGVNQGYSYDGDLDAWKGFKRLEP